MCSQPTPFRCGAGRTIRLLRRVLQFRGAEGSRAIFHFALELVAVRDVNFGLLAGLVTDNYLHFFKERCSVTWHGVAWRGTVWLGALWRGVAWGSEAWRDAPTLPS